MDATEVTKQQLRSEIEETKGKISGTVEQIQGKIRLEDWRSRMEHGVSAAPWRAVGLAAGAGFLLSAGVGGYLFKNLFRHLGSSLGTALSTAGGAYLVRQVTAGKMPGKMHG